MKAITMDTALASLTTLLGLPADDVRNVSQAIAAGLHLACAKTGHQCATCRARWATIRMVEATVAERENR